MASGTPSPWRGLGVAPELIGALGILTERWGDGLLDRLGRPLAIVLG